MADRVLNEHEIVLNSVKFPIEGNVRETLISRFPAKMTTGDYSYANEQILSNWILGWRDGMLVEEMDESIHVDRYWWSTCDTRFKNNLTLGPLATQLTAAITAPANETVTNGTMEADTTWTGGSRSSTQAHAGTYSRHASSVGGNVDSYQDMTVIHAGLEITYTGWVIVTETGSGGSPHAHLILDDGLTETESAALTPGTWTQYSVTKTLSTLATRQRLILRATNSGASTTNAYFDDVGPVTFTTITPSTGNIFHEFNGALYQANGSWIAKLDATGAIFYAIRKMPATITALVHDETYMYVLVGDASAYWYMTTAEVFAITDEMDCHFGVWWNDCLFVFDSAGACKYIAAPGVASPAFTANGSLPIADNELQNVFTYFDADGNDIIYCSTKVGLFAHNLAGAKFIHTALKVPSHPTAGKGAVVWHDGCFISAGLSVHKYVAGGTATITKMGLDQDDGMPTLRNGEVVAFIEGYNEFFALVDSTYEGATSRSQVVSYDGQGWRTWWEATADNKNMYSGIVSSVYRYAVWFATTDGVYWIALQRTSLNPKKISGYTYGLGSTSGIHITPRFDSGTKAFPKLATKVSLFLDDMSATETVTVTYQIDQAAGALTSGWTALGSAQTADGMKELTFGTNAVGVEFYDIQFRVALARTTTNTLSPIVKAMVLSYLKLTSAERLKAWSFTINTSEASSVGSTPKALVVAIATILATNTLMLFTFRDASAAADTHYVMLQPYNATLPTGQNFDGTYSMTVIEAG